MLASVAKAAQHAYPPQTGRIGESLESLVSRTVMESSKVLISLAWWLRTRTFGFVVVLGREDGKIFGSEQYSKRVGSGKRWSYT